MKASNISFNYSTNIIELLPCGKGCARLSYDGEILSSPWPLPASSMPARNESSHIQVQASPPIPHTCPQNSSIKKEIFLCLKYIYEKSVMEKKQVRFGFESKIFILGSRLR